MVVPKPCYRSIVRDLIKKKGELEERINTHGRTLQRNNVGMTESLIDDHGFPRNDIDVYEVREARHQIICLQNDMKAILMDIEKGLHAIHADLDPGESASASDAASKMTTKMAAVAVHDCSDMKPFMVVQSVSRGSPGHEAGFSDNDRIVVFGSVNATNFRGLAHIGEMMKNRECEIILVKVIRDEQLVELGFIPHKWAGRGLMGCNLVLCDNVDR